MERMTTDNPQNNSEHMRNMAFIKDREVWLRGLGETGEDINLYDYIRKENPDLAQYNNDDLADILCDEISSPLELAYWLAVGFAEVRQKLSAYEDTGLNPDEAEGLAQARRDKQLVELVEYPQDMKDLLEPLKIQSALRSCLMVLEFRKEHEPDKISILDYTVIAALHKAFQEAEATLAAQTGGDQYAY